MDAHTGSHDWSKFAPTKEKHIPAATPNGAATDITCTRVSWPGDAFSMLFESDNLQVVVLTLLEESFARSTWWALPIDLRQHVRTNSIFAPTRFEHNLGYRTLSMCEGFAAIRLSVLRGVNDKILFCRKVEILAVQD